MDKIKKDIGPNPVQTFRSNFTEAATTSLQNTFGIGIYNIASYLKPPDSDVQEDNDNVAEKEERQKSKQSLYDKYVNQDLNNILKDIYETQSYKNYFSAKPEIVGSSGRGGKPPEEEDQKIIIRPGSKTDGMDSLNQYAINIEQQPSEFELLLSHHKNERFERARDGLKKYDDYRTVEGDKIVEKYNPRNDVYDLEGNVYHDNINAKASLESGMNFIKFGANHINHGADFIWNNAKLHDPETNKFFDTDPNNVRDLVKTTTSYGFGKVVKGVIAVDQGFKKIFDLDKSLLEAYIGFRDEICTTQNQKDFMDFGSSSFATAGTFKVAGLAIKPISKGVNLVADNFPCKTGPMFPYVFTKKEVKWINFSKQYVTPKEARVEILKCNESAAKFSKNSVVVNDYNSMKNIFNESNITKNKDNYKFIQNSKSDKNYDRKVTKISENEYIFEFKELSKKT